jgi:hypothetical protein
MEWSGGVLEFDPHLTLRDHVRVIDECSGDHGLREISGLVKADSSKRGYASLTSLAFTAEADRCVVDPVGNLSRLGWVNVIVASSRKFNYGGGVVVEEYVDSLPTWDDMTEDRYPYYDNTCWTISKREMDEIMFSDQPCLPPGYDELEHEGIPLGRIEMSNNGTVVRMQSITGRDKYVACLVLEDKVGKRHVAWSIPWEVLYDAAIGPGDGAITVGADSKTRVYVRAERDPSQLLGDIAGKQSSVKLKRYRKIVS